ncbi:hypothetical protein G9C98_000862 [Cotesia typhae]|uniref:Rheb n=1 Tax=Cotesia typhae TaxID=2053667 RepID=A0A8J5V0K2_9HYME|nr:hypothetical protein G9C98_000862 [Cotesia typhae]
MPPKQRKIAIMGNRSVGKSSLSIQFVEGQFVDSYDPTIENTFTKNTRVNGQDYEVKLVDTAGQDEYSIFPTQYSMDIHGYVVPIVLVGNKTDLYVDRMVTTEQGKKLADSWQAVFLETSAKQNESVADIFHTLLMEIEKADGNVQEKSNCLIS